MFILYIDGSGSVRNPGETYFILSGLAVFERQIYHMIKDLDDLVATFNIGPAEQIELHGSPMYGGQIEPWRSVRQRTRREEMIGQALNVLNTAS